MLKLLVVGVKRVYNECDDCVQIQAFLTRLHRCDAGVDILVSRMESLGELLQCYIHDDAARKYFCSSLQKQHSSCTKGVLLVAQSGCGKTSILTSIRNALSEDICHYLNCAVLKLCDR